MNKIFRLKLWSYGCLGILLIAILSCTNAPKRFQCDGYSITEFGSTAASKPLFPYLAKGVNWESVEKQVPVAERLHFMDTIYWYNSMYGHTGNSDYTHVFDMNADGAADYVYTGPGPGFDTNEMITIFKINGTVLSLIGILKSLDFEQHVLKRFYLESTVETNSTNVKRHTSYEIDYKGGKPTLRKFYQSEMLDGTEMPASLYKKYSLQTFCGDSVIFHAKRDSIGFTPIEHATPIQGLVFGEKIDANNKKWLFVAVVPMEESISFTDHTYQVGWKQSFN